MSFQSECLSIEPKLNPVCRTFQSFFTFQHLRFSNQIWNTEFEIELTEENDTFSIFWNLRRKIGILEFYLFHHFGIIFVYDLESPSGASFDTCSCKPFTEHSTVSLPAFGDCLSFLPFHTKVVLSVGVAKQWDCRPNAWKQQSSRVERHSECTLAFQTVSPKRCTCL